MNALHRRRMLESGGAALLMWAIGVALAYGVGMIVAWVVRGFRQLK